MRGGRCCRDPDDGGSVVVVILNGFLFFHTTRVWWSCAESCAGSSCPRPEYRAASATRAFCDSLLRQPSSRRVGTLALRPGSVHLVCDDVGADVIIVVRTTRPRGFERETKYLEGFAGFLRKTQNSHERQLQHPRVQYSYIYSLNHVGEHHSSIVTIARG